MNMYFAAGGLVLLLCIAGSAYVKGRSDMDAVYKEKMLVAEQKARAREHELQDATNEITRQYQIDRTRISSDLADALERLRQRPARRVPDPAVTTCNGSTGAELSAEDAGFLEREAARADELRAALDACQGWAKTVVDPH